MVSSVNQALIRIREGYRLTHDVPKKKRIALSLVEPWDIDPIATKMFEI